MARLLVLAVALMACGVARARDCMLIVRSDGAVCVAQDSAELACARYEADTTAMFGRSLYSLSVVDKATRKWSTLERLISAPRGMPAAVALVLADRIPTMVDGVEGSEENVCAPVGSDGPPVLVFVVSGWRTEVPASDVEKVWALLRAGADLASW